jgi:hypothetical protein
VQNAGFLVWTRPRGDDVQVAVDLHGIRIDDNPANPLS